MPSPLFPPTCWTILAEATLAGDASGRQALERLCATYRPPVVVFLRSRGWSHPEAEDLTQDLFAQLLNSRAWKQADRTKGRFRNFLLTILQNMVATQVVRARAQKNGGSLAKLSLDRLIEDSGWEPTSSEAEPSAAFDQEWAVLTLRTACTEVSKRWVERGKEREFKFYSRFLPGSQSVPNYVEAASAIGVSEGAARAAVCRLRNELGEALRMEVSRTVGSPDAVDEEMAYLRSILSRRNVNLRTAAAESGDA